LCGRTTLPRGSGALFPRSPLHWQRASAARAGIFFSYQQLLQIATQPATQHPHHIDIQGIFGPKHSLRDGFTTYSVFWRPGFIDSVACGLPRRLDTSVGVSGPHDFAVRAGTIRLFDASASIASRANVRDDREAPLL
jgi:hypothetical protein